MHIAYTFLKIYIYISTQREQSWNQVTISRRGRIVHAFHCYTISSMEYKLFIRKSKAFIIFILQNFHVFPQRISMACHKTVFLHANLSFCSIKSMLFVRFSLVIVWFFMPIFDSTFHFVIARFLGRCGSWDAPLSRNDTRVH